jgi:5'-nucleotidase
MLNGNYDFSDTIRRGKIKEFAIFRRGELKLGVFGVGIELAGLVPKHLYGNTLYHDPLSFSNDIAGRLKHDYACDLVICLSHLGYQYKTNKISDIFLAKNSNDIDVILGGHTHTFLDSPTVVQNKENKTVLINQVGWAGINLGRIDVYFDKAKRRKKFISSPIIISKKTSEN